MIDLDGIRKGLVSHVPDLREAPRRAAVAMVLRGDPARPEVLFIESAEHPLDPWSGHMVFPGGRVDPEDNGPREAVGSPLANRWDASQREEARSR